jgi:hypothetical protein
MTRLLPLACLLVALLASCGGLVPVVTSPPPVTPAASGSVPGLPTSDVPPLPTNCQVRGLAREPLPDSSCTPGATNQAVTQSNIASTICKSGWSTQQRQKLLPESASQKLKRQVMAAYSIPWSDAGKYEGDHLISIEIGGLPGGPGIEKNYWPEFDDHPKPGYANSKDIVENQLHAAICAHRVTLAAAQHAIATDWITAEQQVGIS